MCREWSNHQVEGITGTITGPGMLAIWSGKWLILALSCEMRVSRMQHPIAASLPQWPETSPAKAPGPTFRLCVWYRLCGVALRWRSAEIGGLGDAVSAAIHNVSRSAEYFDRTRLSLLLSLSGGPTRNVASFTVVVILISSLLGAIFEEAHEHHDGAGDQCKSYYRQDDGLLHRKMSLIERVTLVEHHGNPWSKGVRRRSAQEGGEGRRLSLSCGCIKCRSSLAPNKCDLENRED